MLSLNNVWNILGLCSKIGSCLFIRKYFEADLPIHRVTIRFSNYDSTNVFVNLLKPTGHVMHRQFNIQQLYVLPTLFYVFCIYLRTNSDLCHLHHKLIGFYIRDDKCLLRGTNWVFT